MKKIICTLIILSSTFIVGCFNYRDMNKLLFSLSTIFDVNDSKNVVIYEEFFKATRFGEEKMGREDKVLLKGEGKSVLDAFYDLNVLSGNRIAYDVNKVLIYTERAAKDGLYDLVDSPLRNQKPTLREFMFIYSGTPEDLFNINMGDEKYVGLFLDNTMIYQDKLLTITSLRLDEYSINRLMGSRVNIIPIIKTYEEEQENRVEISGAAVIVEDKMVDKMDSEEVPFYKFLTDDAKIGAIVVHNPEYEGKVMSLDIIKNKTTKYLEYNGDRISYDVKINTVMSLAEVQKGTNVSNENIRKQIEANASKTIKDRCEGLFKRFKNEHIDILDIQKQVKQKYHGIEIDDIMNKVDFNIEVEVMIEGGQNLKDSKEN